VIDTGIRGAVFDLSKNQWERRRLASAEGATVEAPQAPRGVELTRGSGERRELTQRGPGQSPGRKRKRIFSIFQSHRGPPAEKNAHFLPHIFSETTTF